MQPYSDYEIAHQRLRARERKKASFYLWLIPVTIIFLVGLIDGGRLAGLVWPIDLLIGLVPFTKGVELYYESPSRRSKEEIIDQEMRWLFGDDWQITTTEHDYVVAQDRVRKRSIDRWVFLLHSLVFVFINLFILVFFQAYQETGEPGGGWLLSVPAVWVFLYIRHAFMVFPTAKRLEQRERKFGELLQQEIYMMHSEDRPKEKLKRGKQYQLGDDGELEEVEADILNVEEKSKRSIDHE